MTALDSRPPTTEPTPLPATEELDPRSPFVRGPALVDEGTFSPLRPADTSGAMAAHGRINGCAGRRLHHRRRR